MRGAKPGERLAVPRTQAQEIESFGWVFIYVVYKNALEDPSVDCMRRGQRNRLQRECAQLFPAGGAAKVLSARCIISSPTSNRHIMRHIQSFAQNPDRDYFSSLFDWVWTILADHFPKQSPLDLKSKFILRALKKAPTLLSHLQPPAPPPPLTHGTFLDLFDSYLELIEEAKRK